MKGQDVLLSSGDTAGSYDWETPKLFYDFLNHYFGPFRLDTAATQKTSKCDSYYSSRHNGLKQAWFARWFCNPPYGDGLGDWVEYAANAPWPGLMLLPARTDTAWYHDIIVPRASAILSVRGRIKFKQPGKKNSATFPSLVVTFGMLHWSRYGTIVQPREHKQTSTPGSVIWERA